MKIDKLKLLKISLNLGGLYYVIGAVCHFFGLTLYPFYDSHMYSPYHDTLIALETIVLSLFLFMIARDPIKNIDALNVAITSCFIAIAFSFWILWKIDITPLKWNETVVETVLLVIFTTSLIILKPKKQ